MRACVRARILEFGPSNRKGYPPGIRHVLQTSNYQWSGRRHQQQDQVDQASRRRLPQPGELQVSNLFPPWWAGPLPTAIPGGSLFSGLPGTFCLDPFFRRRPLLYVWLHSHPTKLLDYCLLNRGLILRGGHDRIVNRNHGNRWIVQQCPSGAVNHES